MLDINMGLYFIALIPHGALREEIRKIKERMRDGYGAGHALKSPAHITLQIPFKRSSADEGWMAEVLRTFAANEKPFTVDLNGYGAFAPRVIFIKIVEPGPVIGLHSRLKKVLLEELHFDQDEVMKSVQPHITVATRDLTKKAFSEAWPEIKGERIISSFRVNSITLLSHTGKLWEILEDFNFRHIDESE